MLLKISILSSYWLDVIILSLSLCLSFPLYCPLSLCHSSVFLFAIFLFCLFNLLYLYTQWSIPSYIYLHHPSISHLSWDVCVFRCFMSWWWLYLLHYSGLLNDIRVHWADLPSLTHYSNWLLWAVYSLYIFALNSICAFTTSPWKQLDPVIMGAQGWQK